MADAAPGEEAEEEVPPEKEHIWLSNSQAGTGTVKQEQVPGQVVSADEAGPLLGRVVQDVARGAPQRYLFGRGSRAASSLP